VISGLKKILGNREGGGVRGREEDEMLKEGDREGGK